MILQIKTPCTVKLSVVEESSVSSVYSCQGKIKGVEVQTVVGCMPSMVYLLQDYLIQSTDCSLALRCLCVSVYQILLVKSAN